MHVFVPPHNRAAIGFAPFNVGPASFTLTTSSLIPGRNAIFGVFSLDTMNVCFVRALFRIFGFAIYRLLIRKII
jgi:hypothetical protein